MIGAIFIGVLAALFIGSLWIDRDSPYIDETGRLRKKPKIK